MRLLKYFGALGVVLLLLAVIAVRFSAVESRFQCPGRISSSSLTQILTIDMRLEKYRSWAGLWSDSYGVLSLEIPNETLSHYEHIVETGNKLQIFDSQKQMKGHFSTLTNVLALNTSFGFFEGVCKRVE